MTDDTRKQTFIRKANKRDATTIFTSDLELELLTKRSAPELLEAALRLEPESGAEIRLVLVDGHQFVARDLRCSADDYVVIGRHSLADVAARDCSAMSLRHVLAIPGRIDTTPTLELVPLAPSCPVISADAQLPPSLNARGDAYALGEALLFVAPLRQGHTQKVAQLCARSARVDDACVRVAKEVASRARSYVRTRVTSTPLALVPQIRIAHGEAALVLEVRSSTLRVSFDLEEDWLKDGILLGRSDSKCTHRALRLALTSELISRAHLFLRREGELLVFYDLGSSNGSYVDGAAVRRVAVAQPLAAGPSEQDRPESALIVLGKTGASVRLVPARDIRKE